MQANYGDIPGGPEGTISGFKDRIGQILNIGIADFANAISRLTEGAVKINQTFGQGRQRIIELQRSISDAVPEINKLGGGITQTIETIEGIAAASRRNVIANKEDVQELFAASKFLGQSAQVITESFLDVGVAVSDVAENLEKSIQYVQSIGGNSREVVEKMRVNMEQLNRYQFEGGVVGLTKMAAQASMLRFDMSQTFNLAERVLDPEGAIEVASAFQRLGVAAGNLVDPFQLMNQSINDPSGLQNSLADIAKQFTYFDEKTKSFKINPQGVLTLKEMEKQTGVSAREMSKMGLAAAELDKRLSAIRTAGLVIASEEDKQFLANIARMGEGGEYEVEIKNEQGDRETKKLSEITQKEFDDLIREQRDGPKTLEELARSQMSITEIMQNDLSAIRNKVVGGIATAPTALEGAEGLRNVIEILGKEVGKIGSVGNIRGLTEQGIQGVKQLYKDLTDPTKNAFDVLESAAESMGGELEKLGKDFDKAFDQALISAKEQMTSKDFVTQKAAEYLGKFTNVTAKPESVGTNTARAEQASAGVRSTVTTPQIIEHKVNIGDFELKITSNQQFTEPQLQQITQAITTQLRSVPNMSFMSGIAQQTIQQNPYNPTPTQ